MLDMLSRNLPTSSASRRGRWAAPALREGRKLAAAIGGSKHGPSRAVAPINGMTLGGDSSCDWLHTHLFR